MTASLTCFSKTNWDGRRISRSNSKHNTASMMHALVRTYREYLLCFRHPWNDTKIDILDALFLDEIAPEPIAIDHALAIVLEERTGRSKVIFSVTLVNCDWRSGAGRYDQ